MTYARQGDVGHALALSEALHEFHYDRDTALDAKFTDLKACALKVNRSVRRRLGNRLLRKSVSLVIDASDDYRSGGRSYLKVLLDGQRSLDKYLDVSRR